MGLSKCSETPRTERWGRSLVLIGKGKALQNNVNARGSAPRHTNRCRQPRVDHTRSIWRTASPTRCKPAPGSRGAGPLHPPTTVPRNVLPSTGAPSGEVRIKQSWAGEKLPSAQPRLASAPPQKATNRARSFLSSHQGKSNCQTQILKRANGFLRAFLPGPPQQCPSHVLLERGGAGAGSPPGGGGSRGAEPGAPVLGTQ